MSSNEKTLLYLKEVEEAADLVLTTKQEIVDLDRKRNSNREALSAFEKQLKLVQSKFSNVILHERSERSERSEVKRYQKQA